MNMEQSKQQRNALLTTHSTLRKDKSQKLSHCNTAISDDPLRHRHGSCLGYPPGPDPDRGPGCGSVGGYCSYPAEAPLACSACWGTLDLGLDLDLDLGCIDDSLLRNRRVLSRTGLAVAAGDEEGGRRSGLVPAAVAAGPFHYQQHWWSWWQGRECCSLTAGGRCGSGTASAVGPAGAAAGRAAETGKDGARGNCRGGHCCCLCPHLI